MVDWQFVEDDSLWCRIPFKLTTYSLWTAIRCTCAPDSVWFKMYANKHNSLCLFYVNGMPHKPLRYISFMDQLKSRYYQTFTQLRPTSLRWLCSFTLRYRRGFLSQHCSCRVRARRYFRLEVTGLLSYCLFLQPGSQIGESETFLGFI